MSDESNDEIVSVQVKRSTAEHYAAKGLVGRTEFGIDLVSACARPVVDAALPTVLAAAGQLGAAYRGDWSDFDGRSLRAQLDDLADIASGKRTLTQFRAGCGLCPAGRGHWDEHCDDGCAAVQS